MVLKRMEGLLDSEAANAVCGMIDALDAGSGELRLDFSSCLGAESVALARIIQSMATVREKGFLVSIIGADESLSEKIETLTSYASGYRRSVSPSGFRFMIEEIGGKVAEILGTVTGLWTFAGATFSAVLGIRRNPRLMRWKQILYYMEQSGVHAVPIIAALCWMLGVVLGFQAGYQLKTFAAELFMPDAVAYSITWEIGPLLAAVMVAGRSGSAFAAELGTMKVRQEIDALKVMGLDVWSYLVTPKMLALMIVMPFLVLLADFFGLLGGLLIGGWYLGMPAHVYLSRLDTVMIPMDIYWGMLKSIIYAVIIANVGCYMGMRVKGGAAEVGRAATSAVVAGIFLVIVADSLISLIFVFIRPTLSV